MFMKKNNYENFEYFWLSPLISLDKSSADFFIIPLNKTFAKILATSSTDSSTNEMLIPIEKSKKYSTQLTTLISYATMILKINFALSCLIFDLYTQTTIRYKLIFICLWLKWWTKQNIKKICFVKKNYCFSFMKKYTNET